MVSAGQFITIGLVVLVCVLGLQTVNSFKDSTVDSCTEQYNTTILAEGFAGNYSNTTLLPYFLPNHDALLNFTGTADALTISGCSLTPASQTIPSSCMQLYLPVTVANATITNMTVTYRSLGNCSMGLNDYVALKNTSNIITPIMGLLPWIVFLLLMAIIIPTIWGALQRD